MPRHKSIERHWGDSTNNVNAFVNRFWDINARKPYTSPCYLETSIGDFVTFELFLGSGYGTYRPDKPSIYDSPLVVNEDDRTHILNSAYAKFRDAAIDQAQNANNALEIESNMKSIAKKATTLLSAWRKVKKGDVSGALKKLGVSGTSASAISAIKRRSKQASDIWLEIHFGWVPLAQDIHTSIDAMTRPDLGRRRVQSRQTVQFSSPYSSIQHFSGHITETTVGNYGMGSMTIKMQSDIRISNPNALLANQLGLVNPLAVAWEAVPFSFVVDWFSTVGEVINSLTDFVGLSLEKAYTSYFYQGVRSQLFVYEDSNDPSLFSSQNEARRFVFFKRSLGIEGPSFALKPFKGFSLVRGATAISLLVQHFKS